MANYESIQLSYNSAEPTEPASMTFEQMYGMYREMLLRSLRKSRNIPENEHEEIVQDAMIKAFTHFNDYEDIGESRKAWLFTILNRTIIDRVRYNNHRPYDPASDMRAYDNNASIENGFAEVEENSSFQTALDHVARILTDKEVENGWYATFYLYAVEEKQYNEIAPILGVREGTVKSRLNRIRKRLVADAALRKYAGEEPLKANA